MWGGGGGVCCQTFYFILFSLFSRPREGLATNTLKVRNNNNSNNNNNNNNNRETTMEYTNCCMLLRHVIFTYVCWDYSSKLARMYMLMYQIARRENNRNPLFKS